MRLIQLISYRVEIFTVRPGRAAWWALAMIWLACGAACFGQPVAPSGLVATAVSPQQILLAWNDNSSNELGFQIERSSDGIAFSAITTTSANVIAFAATNLNPAIKYYFRVRAFSGAGNSAYSNTNNATTLTPLVQWQLANFTPALMTNAAVSGLGADPDADGMVNLFEYALNRQPLLPDNTNNVASAGIETILANSYLTLNYRRNAAAIDVLFGVKVSSNLTAWSSGTNVATGPISISTNAGFVTEKFRANAPLISAPKQFMQLTAAYNGVPNSWEVGPAMPYAMVEMTSAWLDDKLYVTGFSDGYNPVSSSHMLAYDISSNTWTNQVPDRPYKGNHHAAEVWGGRLYLIGGRDDGSDGQVQIYDPATNGWSLGATMPYPAGSCASSVISGKIYVAGGLVGTGNGFSTNAAAAYDPASNVWGTLPSLPFTVGAGMNHTASATDGNKFYIFGGRNVPNQADNGYNTVQIYDPASNTWVSSSDPGSTLSPLPQARGGMGKAVFYNGDFYVMGGETVNGSGATPDHVYNRVDIYNVAANTWRLGTPMPTARHGIYPVLRGNRIYVAGGGPISGPYYSTSFDIYVLP